MTNFLLSIIAGAVLAAVVQDRLNRLDRNLSEASGKILRVEDERWRRKTGR